MKDLIKISEIFTSLQGEGKYAGEMAVFLRFSKCNCQCSFCDTKDKMAKYFEATPNAIKLMLSAELEKHPKVKNIVITGGEPFANLKELEEIFKYSKDESINKAFFPNLVGKRLIIETNGTLPFKDLKLDDIHFMHIILSISPKFDYIKDLNPLLLDIDSYFKVLVDENINATIIYNIETAINFWFFGNYSIHKNYPIYLQAVDNKLSTYKKLIENDCYGHSLSIQLHKILGVE